MCRRPIPGAVVLDILKLAVLWVEALRTRDGGPFPSAGSRKCGNLPGAVEMFVGDLRALWPIYALSHGSKSEVGDMPPGDGLSNEDMLLAPADRPVEEAYEPFRKLAEDMEEIDP